MAAEAAAGKEMLDEPLVKALSKSTMMHAGHQHADSPDALRFLAAFGVNSICSDLPSRRFDEKWTVEGLTKLRERVESFGIRLEMVPLPLSSSPFSDAEHPNIMLAKVRSATGRSTTSAG